MVNVTRGTRQTSATAWIQVKEAVSLSYRVLSRSSQFVGSAKGRLLPTEQINVAALSAGVSGTEVEYQWFGYMVNVTAETNSTQLVEIPSSTLQSESGGYSMVASEPGQPPSLVIAPHTLEGGRDYVFGVRALGVDGSGVVQSNVTLQMNDTPRAGNVTVWPTEGYAGETEFWIEMDGFEDVDIPCLCVCVCVLRKCTDCVRMCIVFLVSPCRLCMVTDVYVWWCLCFLVLNAVTYVLWVMDPEGQFEVLLRGHCMCIRCLQTHVLLVRCL